MTITEIAHNRLFNQKIESTSFTTANEVVSWMGAMQAQDYAMAKWAVALRMQHATDDKIEEALNKGEIIRTHLLRPTWHLVSASDIYWMLELTAPRIKSSMKSRNKELELTDEVFNKSYTILEKALSGNMGLSREKIAQLLNAVNIKTDENRLSHILMGAELEGLICSGIKTGNKLTYGLLTERVPNRNLLSRDESLAELAKRYFTSHGPATVKDFTWWSGLAVSDATKALNFVKSGFISETIGTEDFFYNVSIPNSGNSVTGIHLLPAFDEFLISYRDRSAAIALDHNKKAISDNGIFWPVILINGQVEGTWKRSIKKNTLIIETHFFRPELKIHVQQIEKEAGSFGKFLAVKAVVVNPGK